MILSTYKHGFFRHRSAHALFASDQKCTRLTSVTDVILKHTSSAVQNDFFLSAKNPYPLNTTNFIHMTWTQKWNQDISGQSLVQHETILDHHIKEGWPFKWTPRCSSDHWGAGCHRMTRQALCGDTWPLWVTLPLQYLTPCWVATKNCKQIITVQTGRLECRWKCICFGEPLCKHAHHIQSQREFSEDNNNLK